MLISTATHWSIALPILEQRPIKRGLIDHLPFNLPEPARLGQFCRMMLCGGSRPKGFVAVTDPAEYLGVPYRAKYRNPNPPPLVFHQCFPTSPVCGCGYQLM